MSEREVQHDPQVLEGEDELPRQPDLAAQDRHPQERRPIAPKPGPPTDPYTPEPGPGPGERRAFGVMRLAWIVLAIAVAIVLIALLR